MNLVKEVNAGPIGKEGHHSCYQSLAGCEKALRKEDKKFRVTLKGGNALGCQQIVEAHLPLREYEGL